MEHSLPKLPYALDALEPFISQETINYHYNKHHAAYIKKLNTLIKGSVFENMPLEEIIRKSSGEIFNNAGQTWNHNFYWQCLTPKLVYNSNSHVAQAIQTAFDSFEKFQTTFNKSAATNFGSGWTWLVKAADGSVAIRNTSNAENPLLSGETPLLTCDIWEHAYYIDYRNERLNYLNAFWNIVNWEFVERSFSGIKTENLV